MTWLQRMRVRIRMSLRHRPFWLEVFAGKALAAWGIYVVLMPLPIGHVHAFALLQQLPHANAWMGGTATAVGLSRILIVISNVAAGRLICAFASSTVWSFAALIEHRSNLWLPSSVLYAEPIIVDAFAFGWLIWDWTRTRTRRG